VDVGYFDRNVTEAESLAISNSRKHLYGFLLGSTVATWIVNPENPIITIDSLQAWEILTGKTTSWRNIGWINQPINIYLPPLGDGAWNELTNFFHGSLKQLKANFWPNDSLIIEQVSKDPYALGFIGRQIFNGKVKKLRWVNPLLEDPVPANIGALQEGKYPFKIRLYYFTIGDKTDLASGFLSFMASNAGQRLISDNGFLPEMVPVRAVTLTGSGNK
jgi:phosphate transport system substrate-binding protein